VGGVGYGSGWSENSLLISYSSNIYHIPCFYTYISLSSFSLSLFASIPLAFGLRPERKVSGGLSTLMDTEGTQNRLLAPSTLSIVYVYMFVSPLPWSSSPCFQAVLDFYSTTIFSPPFSSFLFKPHLALFCKCRNLSLPVSPSAYNGAAFRFVLLTLWV